MFSILGWLVGSKAGRIVALVALAAASAGVVIWRVYAAGGKSERAKQIERTLTNVSLKVQTDEEIRRLPAADRRDRLREWARD
jgi:hypothetical protein